MGNKNKKEIKNISNLEIALKEQNRLRLQIKLAELQKENSKQKENEKKVEDTKEYFRNLGYDIE